MNADRTGQEDPAAQASTARSARHAKPSKPPKLLDLPVRDYLGALASSAAAPGGGSAAALAGALGASLVEMVAQLTVGREEFKDIEHEVRALLGDVESLRLRLADLVDADAAAYAGYAGARRLPRTTPEERRARRAALQAALRDSTAVPLELAEACADLLRLAHQAAVAGNLTVISDAAVGALLADAALRSAEVNVACNLKAVRDQAFAAAARKRLAATVARAAGLPEAVAAEVRRRLES